MYNTSADLGDVTATGWLQAAVTAAAGRDRDFLASPFVAEATRIEQSQSGSARAAFLRQSLGSLVEIGRPRISGLRVPEEIQRKIHREFDRIDRELRTAGDEHYDLAAHGLRCDFRIAGFGRIPVGVEHIEIGGVPRRLAWSGGLGQARSVVSALARAGGWKPYYVAHVAHGIKPWAFLMAYNPETQAAWQKAVADCLRLNPHVRGLLATSWWYDPQLTRVAPHLTFLREKSLAHGAILVRAGTEGAQKHALANSPERQKLHAAGQYNPVSYGMLWTRDALLKWASQ